MAKNESKSKIIAVGIILIVLVIAVVGVLIKGVTINIPGVVCMTTKYCSEGTAL